MGILERFSCRAFASDPLTEADTRRLLESARWAPSAGNCQPWRFIAVTSSRIRRELARAAGQEFVADAPLVIAVCAVPHESERRYGERGRSLYVLQDTAAATQNILLAASDIGLGSCWVGAFDERTAAAALDLPPGWRPVALVPVGRPLERPGRRERRPLQEVAVFKAD
ncbi:MAG TPA: nitroreductase family protein [Thermoanaerobaculaceae bacterium]|nr:nitroreductase family protein [Thermoanaerobaculaceae bacterium]